MKFQTILKEYSLQIETMRELFGAHERISDKNADRLCDILDAAPAEMLAAFVVSKIRFVSSLSRNRLSRKFPAVLAEVKAFTGEPVFA